jgi:hypothetical protein
MSAEEDIFCDALQDDLDLDVTGEQREAQLEEARLAEVHHQAQEDAVAAEAANQA